MTTQEFSDEFDVLYNNITSNQAPGLDEYEKSVFLTLAQDELILSYFNPKLNKVLEGFDGSERRQIDFSSLIEVKTITPSGNGKLDTRTETQSVSVSRGHKILLIIGEQVIVTRGEKSITLLVVPVSQQEYSRLMVKPFARPIKRLAWRVITDGTSEQTTTSGEQTTTINFDFTADLIVGPGDTITKYTIRYVQRPTPIIVGELGTDVTIGGLNTTTECTLNPIIHLDILKRAVDLAKIAWQGDLNGRLAQGMSSSTEAGMVTRQ